MPNLIQKFRSFKDRPKPAPLTSGDYVPLGAYDNCVKTFGRRAFHRLKYCCTLGKTERVKSKLINSHRTLPPTDFRAVLSNPIKMAMKIPMKDTHSHPGAASLRTTTAKSIEQVIQQAGYTTYSVSTSNRDKYDGQRLFFMAKDLGQPFRDDRLTRDHVLVMIDVDYYLDINKYLAYGRPIIMYTFSPCEAAGPCLDGRFRITDNTVEYIVSGGATYNHQIWDYTGDTVSWEMRDRTLVVYDVEQKTLDADKNRRIVCLTPKAYIPYPYAAHLNTGGFRRKNFTDNGVNVVFDPVANKLSLAANGGFDAIEIAGDTFKSLKVRLSTVKDPKLSDVERLLRVDGFSDPAKSAAIIFPLIKDFKAARTVTTDRKSVV